jgi:hypothetical protein
MSIGNLKDYGNKGNNFPFQLKVLQGLDFLSPRPVTPVILQETASDILRDECTSICFANVGTVNVDLSFDGGNTSIRLAPGISVNMDAGDYNDYYPSNTFAWDAGAYGAGELLITYNQRPQ